MSEIPPAFATSIEAPSQTQSETPAIPPSKPTPVSPAPRHHHMVYPTVLDTGRSLLSIIVIALFVLTFIVQPFRIPSESMEHTLLVGDFLLVNKMIYAPPGIWRWLLPYRQIQRGDIVVFHFPIDPNDHVVKRVIAVPGDRVHLHNGLVFLNGQPEAEPYAVYEASYSDNFRDQFPTCSIPTPASIRNGGRKCVRMCRMAISSCRPVIISSLGITATTAATADTGDLYPGPTSLDVHSSSTFRSVSPLPQVSRISQVIDSDTIRIRIR